MPAWNISYFPESPLLEKFFLKIAKELEERNSKKVHVNAFKDYKSFIHRITYYNHFVGVIFDGKYVNLTSFPKHFRFDLVFPSEMRTEDHNPKENNWKGDTLFPEGKVTKPRGYNNSIGGNSASYILEGFITMEYYISTQYIKEVLAERDIHSHTNYQEMNLSIVKFPDPPFVRDNFIDKTAFLILPMIPFSYFSVFVTTVYFIAEEKER